MAAPQSEGEAQKLRFGPWLLNAITTGIYQGLCWTDASHTTFRVPWKHNARKDVTSSDLEVFKAWAKVSGRYEGCPEDPAKWKTNFRCALTSTGMFELLEDHSKRGDDPHKVFGITPVPAWRRKEGDFNSTDPPVEQQLQMILNPQEVATPEIHLPGTTDPAQSLVQDMELLPWVLQHCNISPSDFRPPDPSWAPAGNNPQQDALLHPHLDPIQNHCPSPPVFQQWVPPQEQPTLDAYSPPAPMQLEEAPGAVLLPCPLPEVTVPVQAPEDSVLFARTASPAPPPPPPEGNTDFLHISIFYRGKLFHEEEVRVGQCLLAYQPSDPALAQRPGSLVHFPSPTKVADVKQRHFTEKLLCNAGLQLEQHAHKIYATRLKKCKVFWALSQQLEGVEEPPCNMLDRDQATLIFDFSEFCTELRDFRSGQRRRSPDFTIYLCFGQCFSNAKPKESKLILVKLVPKFCEYFYEKVLQEGASSLDSGTVSLQLSDSFSLFELIEHYNMHPPPPFPGHQLSEDHWPAGAI